MENYKKDIKRKEKMQFTPKETNAFFINKVTKLNAVGVDRTLAIEPTKKLEEKLKSKEKGEGGKNLVFKTVQEGKVKKNN